MHRTGEFRQSRAIRSLNYVFGMVVCVFTPRAYRCTGTRSVGLISAIEG
jgi:hypothetical protein